MLSCLLLAACEPEGGGDPLARCGLLAAAEPWVAVGTGQDTLTLVEDGMAVPTFLGPQGGQHAFGAAQVWGLLPGDPSDLSDPTNPIVSFTVASHDGMVRGGYEGLPRPLKPLDDGTHHLLGDVLVTSRFPDDALPTGLPATLDIHLVDACGTEVSDTTEIVLLPPESP